MHLSRWAALVENTLPELLYAWLHSRQWQRDQVGLVAAERLHRLTDMVILQPVDQKRLGAYQKRTRDLADQVERLAGPEMGEPVRVETNREHPDPFIRAAYAGERGG